MVLFAVLCATEGQTLLHSPSAAQALGTTHYIHGTNVHATEKDHSLPSESLPHPA